MENNHAPGNPFGYLVYVAWMCPRCNRNVTGHQDRGYAILCPFCGQWIEPERVESDPVSTKEP